MTHHKLFGSLLTDANEVHKNIVVILYNIYIYFVPMVLQYNVCGVELPIPVIFNFLVCLLILSTYTISC